MIHRPALAILVVLAIAITALGCRGPAASGTLSPTAAPSPTSATGTSPSPDAAAGPPEASLGVEGGDAVTGQLGSYTWSGGGSDSPWLPGAPLRVGPDERLTMTLAGDVGIGRWTARRVPAGATDGAGATGLGSGSSGPVTFTAPPPGAWSVQVTVQFAGDLGSASYYWRLDVT